MKALRASILMMVCLTALTGGLYPLVVTVLAQVAFPGRANGSLIEREGTVVGSALIGQAFSKPGCFWSRPSATSPAAYNAASSGGSNLGPLNPALAENARKRIEELRAADASIGSVPVDLVTASGSGLDPHISPKSAIFQSRRVAEARGRSEAEVRRLIERYTEGRQFGILGEPRVNVLLLNLALDEAFDRP
jgi:K+-transporting ATPase ATPase C chain